MKFKSIFFHDIETLNDLWNLTQRSNKTALICAVDKGHIEIVELLMRQKDIDANIQGIHKVKIKLFSLD